MKLDNPQAQNNHPEPPLDAPRRRLHRASRLLSLEQRFMFDGAVVATVADAAHIAPDAAAKTLIPNAPTPVEVRSGDPVLNDSKKEVVFVDTSVTDYKMLEASVRTGIEVVEIGAGQNGLAQIAKWAESHSGYDAIHLLGHGSVGALHLGSDTLTSTSMATAEVRAELAELGHALKAGGDLLVYGCDIAQGADGQAWLDQLAQATGADVAASIDDTGAQALGGNWILERQDGQIDASLPFGSAAIQSYSGLLATFGFTTATGSGTKVVQQTVGSDQIVFTATDQTFLVDTDTNMWGGGVANVSGNVLGTGQGGWTFESKVRIEVLGGKIFDLSSFSLVDMEGANKGLRITTDKGYQDFSAGFIANSWQVLPGGAKFTGISWAEITTTDASNQFSWAFDNVVLNNISLPGPSFTSGTTANFNENATGTVYTAHATASSGTVTYALGGTDAGKFDLDTSSGVLTFKTSPDYENPTDAGGNNIYDVTITATDSNGSTSRNVAITVNNLPDSSTPTFTSGATASFNENATGTVYTAQATASAGTVTYALGGTDAGKFNLDTSSGVLTFKSPPDYENPTDAGGNNIYDVTITATDSNGSTSRNVAITVNDVYEVPVITSGATFTGDAGDTSTDATVYGSGSQYAINITDNASGNTLHITSTGTPMYLDTAVNLGDASTGMSGKYIKTDLYTDWTTSITLSVVGGKLFDFKSLDLQEANGTPTTFIFTPNGGAGQTRAFSANQYGLVDYSGNSSFQGISSLTITATSGQFELNMDNIVLDNIRLPAPSFTSGTTASFNENATGTVYTAHATASSGTVTYALGGTDAGKFDLDTSSGVLTFKTAPNYESATDAGGDNVYNVTITATDSNGSATRNVAITVNDVNEAPAVTSLATASFAENGTGTVYTATATDPDAGQTLTWSLSGTDAAPFNINSSTGAVTFNSAPNYEAPADSGADNVYNITVIASDNGTGNLTASQAVAITVTDVNDAPTISSSGTASFAENGTGTVYTATGTDQDAGQTLSWSLGGTDAGSFSINSSTGAVTFNSAPNYESPADSGGDNVYNINVIATDNGTGNLTASKAVTITVTNVNEAPTVTSGATASFAENGTGTAYTATATDSDAGQTLTWSLSGTDAALFNINSSTGAVTFNSAPNYESPADSGADNVYNITVIATDNGTGNLSASKALAITVTNINDAPTLSTVLTLTGATEDSAYTITYASLIAAANTADQDSGATLSFRIESVVSGTLTKGGSVVVPGTTLLSTGESLVWTPVADANGTLGAFTVKAYDGSLASSTAVTVDVNVAATNDAPTDIALSSSSVAENTSTAIALTVASLSTTDVDTGDTFTYSIVGGADQNAFQISGSNLQFKAGATLDYETKNSYSVTVRTTDSGNVTYDKTFTISLTNVNEAPVVAIAIPDNSAIVGQAFSYTFPNNTFADPDAGQTLTYTATQSNDSALPAWLTFNGITRTFSGTPTLADVGTLSVKVTATDDGTGNLSVVDLFDLTVHDGPSISSIVRTGGASTTVATATTSIDYTVTFDQAVTGVDAGDFALSKTGTADGSIAGITGSGTTYTVTVNNLSGDGTLRLDLNSSGTGIKNGSNVDIFAGYTSGDSYTLDHTAPSAPTTPVALASASDSGISNSDGITRVTNPTVRVSLAGTNAVAGDTAELLLGGSPLAHSTTATLTGTNITNGYVDLTVTAGDLGTDGAKTLSARIIDAAGNLGIGGGSQTIALDTTAPTAPGTPDLTAASDSGISDTDNVTTVTTPTFTGTAEAGATVTLYEGSTALGTGTADGSGHWSITSAALAEGNHTVTAQATDAAGNTSLASSGLNITIDITAPAAPSAPDLASASDSGSSNTDKLTKITTPTFTGTAEAGATVTLYEGGTLLGTGNADSSGNWSITSSTLSSGTHTITAKATDAAGNASIASSGLTITIDTTPPAVPSAPVMSSSSDTGIAHTDAITSNTAPIFTGTAEAGITVTLYDGTTALGTTTADGAGNWSITSIALSAGQHTITARTTDTAGNISAASAGLVVNIDTSGPVVAFDTLTSTVPLPVLSGTLNEPVSALTITIGGATFNVTPTGTTWHLDLANATPASGTLSLQLGHAYSITAAATDLAGNSGSSASTLNLVVIPNHIQPQSGLPEAPVTPPPQSTVSFTSIEPTGRFLSLGAEQALNSIVGSLTGGYDKLTSSDQGVLNASMLGSRPGIGFEALVVNHAMSDQTIDTSGPVEIRVPADTFIHTTSNSAIYMSARQATGKPLPEWIKFDPASRKFTVNAPAGVTGELSVVLVARDAQGREAATSFKIRLGAKHAWLDHSGRLSLSEQVRMASQQPSALAHLAQFAATAIGMNV